MSEERRLYLVTITGVLQRPSELGLKTTTEFFGVGSAEEARGLAIVQFTALYPEYHPVEDIVRDVTDTARRWAAQNPTKQPEAPCVH